MASSPSERARLSIDRREGTHTLARVDFEKWQALGNDYLIIERAALPFELTEARIRRLCAAHTGVHSDGILLLSEASRARLCRPSADLQP